MTAKIDRENINVGEKDRDVGDVNNNVGEVRNENIMRPKSVMYVKYIAM